MPKMLCRCGADLNDDDPNTTNTFIVFTEQDFDQREAEPDWRKRLPYTYFVWECKVCGRWYFFTMDSDVPERVLIPEK